MAEKELNNKSLTILKGGNYNKRVYNINKSVIRKFRPFGSNNFSKHNFDPVLAGFSKLEKEDKIDVITAVYFNDPERMKYELESYHHPDEKTQRLFDSLSENTLTNFYIPYGVAPNFIINRKEYMVPMVTEESTIIAAASAAAKFWASRGGFLTKVLSTVRKGQLHLIWEGDPAKLDRLFPEIKERLISDTLSLTEEMRKRGGGIKDIFLKDLTGVEEGYFLIEATFDTGDSVGANFVNACLEKFSSSVQKYVAEHSEFSENEDITVVMGNYVNYAPECLAETTLECSIPDLGSVNNLSAKEFAKQFELAVKFSRADISRGVSHNKGIFNGIDAVVLATGNDVRATEACGHAYASRSGRYEGLTTIDLSENTFRYSLTLPLVLGTVGGLTDLHPLAKRSLELLGNPDTEQLMMIAASVGLAANFSAVKALITSGVWSGYMQMKLKTILEQSDATEAQKYRALHYFQGKKVTAERVEEFINELRANAVIF